MDIEVKTQEDAAKLLESLGYRASPWWKWWAPTWTLDRKKEDQEDLDNMKKTFTAHAKDLILDEKQRATFRTLHPQGVQVSKGKPVQLLGYLIMPSLIALVVSGNPVLERVAGVLIALCLLAGVMLALMGFIVAVTHEKADKDYMDPDFLRLLHRKRIAKAFSSLSVMVLWITAAYVGHMWSAAAVLLAYALMRTGMGFILAVVRKELLRENGVSQ